MEDRERQRIYNHAREWILEAGKKIRDSIDEPLTINTKSDANDLVTHMDQDTEKYFAEKITSTFPTHLLLSEEGFGDEVAEEKGTIWIVDPIDGTMNFVHQKRNFAISVGVFHEGSGEIGLIYDVMDDILYSAQKGQGAYKNEQKLLPLAKERILDESIVVVNNFWTCENPKINAGKMQDLVKKVRGTRSYGSAALEFAFVAEGVVDGYISLRLAPWDIAAGVVLVNEVGGETSNVNGTPLNMLTKNTVLSCNPAIKQEIIENYIELK